MPQSIQDQLLSLFNSKEYNNVVSLALSKEISPISDPQASNIVAASLFQLSKFDECLLWCEGLSSTFNTEPSFSSMYGATLRRLNRYDQAASVFEASLQDNPDNPPLLNNYANLLIDAGNLNKAKSILLDLLNKFPDYEDAKANLGRVNFYLEDKSNDRQPLDSPSIENKRPKLKILDDPLSFAFSDEEVAQAGAISKKDDKTNTNSQNSSVYSSLSLEDIASRSDDHELADFIQLIRSTSEHNSTQALSDLNSLHRVHGSKSFIYELAVEVYIRSKNFEQAEKHALIALQLGSKSPSIYLHLANFAHIRGDERLAASWLEHVATNYPDFDQLQPVKERLLKNGVPQHSKSPFV